MLLLLKFDEFELTLIRFVIYINSLLNFFYYSKNSCFLLVRFLFFDKEKRVYIYTFFLGRENMLIRLLLLLLLLLQPNENTKRVRRKWKKRAKIMICMCFCVCPARRCRCSYRILIANFIILQIHKCLDIYSLWRRIYFVER